MTLVRPCPQAFLMDGSQALRNGVHDVYPNADIQDCYPHVARRIENLEAKFQNPQPRDGHPHSGFLVFLWIAKNALPLCRTLEQFKAMAEALVEHLRGQGEEDVAARFCKSFASEHHNLWFCGAGPPEGDAHSLMMTSLFHCSSIMDRHGF